MKTLTKTQACSEQILEILPEIFQHFNIDYIKYPNRYSLSCPIHNGDNKEGCSIFTQGDTSIGNWKCWTASCEDNYGKNIFGFIKGLMSSKNNREVSSKEVIRFLKGFINEDIEFKEYKKNDIMDVFYKDIEEDIYTLSRDEVRSKIKIPSQYYIKRGFSAEILDEFDVGFCNQKGKPMFNRSVVPVYNSEYKYVGCVGRAVDEDFKPKWLHSKGFKKHYLYGYNIAKNFIKNNSIFILEGQGDVWRMHEAGFKNSVGIFGSSMNEEQLIILEKSGVLNLIILTDYDDAGNKAAFQIEKKCGRRFNYYRPKMSKKDIGELSTNELKEELYPQINTIIKE